MRTTLLLDNVDASQAQTSEWVPFQQRAEWLVTVFLVGATPLDGEPHLIIELSNQKESPKDDQAVPLPDVLAKNEPGYFVVDELPFGVKNGHLEAEFFRVRLEPNGNTQGNVSVDFGFKTFP